MKVRIYPVVRYIDSELLTGSYQPTKKVPQWDSTVWCKVGFEEFCTYLDYWYGLERFVKHDGFLEAEFDENDHGYFGKHFINWHLVNLDHQVFLDGKWRSGVVHD